MAEAGASAALRGYRLQALFILDSILQAEGRRLIFYPEGREDLAVRDSDGLVRVVQVKALTENLTLSSLDPRNPESFFRRVLKLPQGRSTLVEVASFGPIGPEILAAWGGEGQAREKATGKLTSYGFSESEVDTLFDTVRFEPVDEAAVRSTVFERLRAGMLGGDPAHAFDLLTQWVYHASEHRIPITFDDLSGRILAVGQYLSERADHHSEWFSAIVPLDEVTVENGAALVEEFHRGAGARYSHILADADVVRHDKLDLIDAAFSKGTRTVVVHGASGQGKSALALRYLHDRVPRFWRFQVRYIEDREHATRVARAIAGHLAAVRAKAFVYLDVTPRDLDWAELVRSLLDQPNVRVLVSIRSEDLARTIATEADLGFPQPVALEFDKMEGELLYQALTTQGTEGRFPSFAEAWNRFGDSGPLMEFVHWVTQTESLQQRLASQVRRIRSEVAQGFLTQEEFAFLTATSVATAYEARVDISLLADELGISDPVRIVELLENEYLIRRTDDGRFAEALHRIRSSILVDHLTDEGISPWIAPARSVLPAIPERDLEAFLLYAASRRPHSTDSLIQILHDQPPRTWTGIAAVARVLLWIGAKEYVERNAVVIREAREALGSRAWMLLDGDIAGVAPGVIGSMTELMQRVNPRVASFLDDLRMRLSPNLAPPISLDSRLANRNGVQREGGVGCLPNRGSQKRPKVVEGRRYRSGGARSARWRSCCGCYAGRTWAR